MALMIADDVQLLYHEDSSWELLMVCLVFREHNCLVETFKASLFQPALPCGQ